VVLNTVFLHRELDTLPIQVQTIGARRTGCPLYNGAYALDLLAFTSTFAEPKLKVSVELATLSAIPANKVAS